jgi:signal transduction histidine kinase
MRNEGDGEVSLVPYIASMRRSNYSPAVLVVGIALLLVVPLLAYLQYQWLGQLSGEEYERMQSNLRSTAYHFSMDLNRELTELLQIVGGTVTGSDESALTTVDSRLSVWKKNTAHPQLAGECTLAQTPAASLAIPLRVDEQSSILFFKDASAFAVPIKNSPERCVLVPLDRDYLKSSVLPELLQTYFASDGEMEYDVVILSKEQQTFFTSTPTLRKDIFEKADLIAQFVYFPPSLSKAPPPRLFGDRERNAGGRDITPGRELPDKKFGNDELRTPPDRERGKQFRGEPSERRFGNDGPRKPPEHWWRHPTLYEVRIKHRKGSLEAVVGASRLRNVAINFGVLLFLAASVVFLLFSANRAQRLAEQQLEFVAGVSHELRTPLAVLKSAGENLADGVIDENNRTKQYGELIKKEVVRLSEMVEKALAYAGVHSRKRKYELHPLDISAVLEEALYSVRRRTAHDGFDIATSIEENLPTVNGDTTALQSAVENLLTNAIKYSGDATRIELRANVVGENGVQHVHIVVRDDGIGIPPNDVKRVFEPFYRGNNAVDAQIEGSGLGLSLTKHIIEAHGGKISVKSAEGKGSVFTIVLPVAIHNEVRNA